MPSCREKMNICCLFHSVFYQHGQTIVMTERGNRNTQSFHDKIKHNLPPKWTPLMGHKLKTHIMWPSNRMQQLTNQYIGPRDSHTAANLRLTHLNFMMLIADWQPRKVISSNILDFVMDLTDERSTGLAEKICLPTTFSNFKHGCNTCWIILTYPLDMLLKLR